MMSVVSAVASPLVLVDKGEDLYLHDQALKKKSFQMNAAVNEHLELTLLKVCKDSMPSRRQILRYINFRIGEP